VSEPEALNDQFFTLDAGSPAEYWVIQAESPRLPGFWHVYVDGPATAWLREDQVMDYAAKLSAAHKVRIKHIREETLYLGERGETL